MSLISCKECGSKASTKAAACPTCGAPIRRPNHIGKAFVRLMASMGGLIGGVLGLMFALSYLAGGEIGPLRAAIAPEVELEARCRKMSVPFSPEERAAFFSNCVKEGAIVLKSYEVSPVASVTNNPISAPDLPDHSDVLDSIELTPRSIPYELDTPASVKNVVLHGQLEQGTLWNTTAYFLTPLRGPKIYMGEAGWSPILDSWVSERAFVQVSGKLNVYCNDDDTVMKSKLEVCDWFDGEQVIKMTRVPKIDKNTKDRVISTQKIGRPVRDVGATATPATVGSVDP